MPARILLIALLLLHPLTGAVSAITTQPTQANHQSCCALCTCGTSCACSAQDPADSPPPLPAPITTSAEPALPAPQANDTAIAPYPAHAPNRINPATASPNLATSSIEAARRLCVWRT